MYLRQNHHFIYHIVIVSAWQQLLVFDFQESARAQVPFLISFIYANDTTTNCIHSFLFSCLSFFLKPGAYVLDSIHINVISLTVAERIAI